MPNKPNKQNRRNNDSGSRESRPPITDTHEQSSDIAIDDSLVLHLIEALKDDRVMRALHTDSDKLHDKIDSLTVLVTTLTTQLENKEQRITELKKPWSYWKYLSMTSSNIHVVQTCVSRASKKTPAKTQPKTATNT